MIRRIAVVLVLISLFALMGLSYLQFSSVTAYVAATEIKAARKITAEDIMEIGFARLRDKKAARLIITDKNKIIGQYATENIKADTIFLNNGMLSKDPPPGRCFKSGRCLPQGYTVWMMSGSETDTLGDTVTIDDLFDIALVDAARRQLTVLVQKAQPLEILEGGVFLFAFTPEQVAVLKGIQESEEPLQMVLLLNQNPNPPQRLLQQYSMDYTSIRADLFPLPDPDKDKE